MEYEHTVILHDELGRAVGAQRHVNPDGSVGGWVAENAAVDPTAVIESGALVMPHAKVGAGVRVENGMIVDEGVSLLAFGR